MKKTIIGSIAVLAISVTIALNMNLGKQGNGLSDISLANIEALAEESSTGAGYYCCGQFGQCVKLSNGDYIFGIKQTTKCPLNSLINKCYAIQVYFRNTIPYIFMYRK